VRKGGGFYIDAHRLVRRVCDRPHECFTQMTGATRDQDSQDFSR
jgi:hypothetical protein